MDIRYTRHPSSGVHHRGMTVIELLLVVGIVALLAVATTPLVSSFLLRNEYRLASDKIVSVIRKAQGYSMDNKDAGTWGVCMTGNTVRMFRGSCGSPAFAEDFPLDASVNVTGLATTTFSLRGEPVPANGLSLVTVSTTLGSFVISVSSAGGILIN